MKLMIIREEWIELQILNIIYFICGGCWVFCGFVAFFVVGFFDVFESLQIPKWEETCYGNPASTVIINESSESGTDPKSPTEWIIKEI